MDGKVIVVWRGDFSLLVSIDRNVAITTIARLRQIFDSANEFSLQSSVLHIRTCTALSCRNALHYSVLYSVRRILL